MPAPAVRRSTRRVAAASTESAQPAQPAQSTSEQGTPPPEAPKRKGRKSRAASKAEPQTVTESQPTVTKARSTSRASSASAAPAAATSSTATSSKATTQQPPAVTFTRAGRARHIAETGQASPQRSLEDARPPKRARSTAPTNETSEKRRAVSTKSASKSIASDQDNDDDDDLGPFFTTGKVPLSPFLQGPASIASESLQQENVRQRIEINQLRARVRDLEAQNQTLADKLYERDQQLLAYEKRDLRMAEDNSRLQQLPNVSNGPPANKHNAEFDSDIFSATQSSPAQPVFINGSESAFALLHKIEQSAKELERVEPSADKSETVSDNDVNKEASQLQSAKRTFTQASATPDPAVESSNIFSRSISAIKSRFFPSSPRPEPVPEVASPTPAFASSTHEVTLPTPTKALPPQNTLTEALSVPPTPVGERVKTPGKKRSPTNMLLKVLLKGVSNEDRRKAENWAKQIVAELRSDDAFREKRKRLETPVQVKDLNILPSAKPWESGIGDPLGHLFDEDFAPVWAVYLDMKAEEEEHKAKRLKRYNATVTDEVPTIDEQFAASQGTRVSPKLYNSNGQSASLQDLHPRRSIDPSPMFSNSVSHTQGGNIFSELQGHDNAAKVLEKDREVLKSATKETVDTQSQSTVGRVFSVPDDSDDDDSTVEVESAKTEPSKPENAKTETTNTKAPSAEAAPIWTQPPPPAPVPAHAPLPGGSAADAPLSPPSQQPVDEIERQRQRLMKHTPAKPSRLREATYPSPSVLSDAGNESLAAATPAPVAASVNSMFDDMPGADSLELDEEELAELDKLVHSEEYKKQLAANWPAPTITYESDEEELSPISA